MSTRACVAQTTGPESWQGVYSHFDGYPTGLGKTIWEVLHRDFLNNPGRVGVSNNQDPHKAVSAFCKIYIDGHPGGWSAFSDNCYCHDPNFVLRDGNFDEMKIDSNYPDPLFMEWVYALDPESLTMTVYSHKGKSKSDPILDEPVETEEGKWDYGHCVYWHEIAAEIDLLGEEPVWEELDKR